MARGRPKTKGAESKTAARGASSPYARGGHDTPFEKNKDLTYTKAHGTNTEIGAWDWMLRTNPIARVSLQSLQAGVQSVKHFIKDPGGVKPDVMDYARKLLFVHPAKRFQKMLKSQIRCIGYGFYPHEITTVLKDGLLYLADLDPRPPRTFSPSTVYRDADGWVHAMQTWYDDQDKMHTAKYGAPGEPGVGWLWWPTFGDGLFGDPLLRPVYAESQEKADIRKIRRMTVQKRLMPTPIVQLRQDADYEEDGRKDEIDATVAEIGGLLYHENAVLVLPPWAERLVDMPSVSAAIDDALKIEDHDDMQTMVAFGNQWMGRGIMSAFGSNAASVSDMTEQRAVRKDYLDSCSDQWQELMDYFVTWNFGEQEVYPELGYIYHEELTLREEAEVAARLATAQILLIDKPLRDHFRTGCGWPEESPAAAPSSSAAPTQWSPVAPDGRTDRPSEGNYTGQDAPL
jgi:hypothetical protein